MITSIVGRLIKKPEVAERIQIPGKHVVNFTLVENRNRGEKRLSVFFNLSLIIGTDAQFDLAMRLDKGTVLLFSAPRITYVRQSDKGETEQTINLYAEADNFKIVAGAGEGSAGSAGALAAGSGAGDNFFAPAAVAATTPMSRAVTSSSSAAARNSAARGAATDLPDLSGPDDADDPFAEYEPAPIRSGATPPAPARGGGSARPAAAPPQPATAPSTARPAPGQSPQSTTAPRQGASRPATRGPAAPPPAHEDDMADLSDPFADGGL